MAMTKPVVFSGAVVRAICLSSCAMIVPPFVKAADPGAANTKLPEVGVAYIVARHALHELDYQAYRWLPRDTSDMSLQMLLPGNNGIRREFPELAFCEGADHLSCHFVFTRNSREFVEIDTDGELPDSMRVVEAKELSKVEAAAVYACHAWNCENTPPE